VPRPGGVLSAFGLLAADESHDAVRTVGLDLADATPERLEGVYEDLVSDVLSDTSDPASATVERAADCRYAGQSFELTVPAGGAFDAAAVRRRFETAHERAYGYAMDEGIEVVNLRATATVEGADPVVHHDGDEEASLGSRVAHFPETGGRETAVYDRDRLAPGKTITGPAILEQVESTTVLPPAWAGDVLGDGTLVMTRAGNGPETGGRGDDGDVGGVDR